MTTNLQKQNYVYGIYSANHCLLCSNGIHFTQLWDASFEHFLVREEDTVANQWSFRPPTRRILRYSQVHMLEQTDRQSDNTVVGKLL